jgi:hypothetical protein
VYSAVLEKFQEILNSISPLVLFVVVILLGMYVFWRGALESRKNMSSIYDVFLISLLSGLGIGRICHIVLNWSRFSNYIWYWLPYEKYGNEVYLFRVLPWRFFRVWDWGIDILAMFIGFLMVATFWVLVVKKWKWNHMFTTIFFTAQMMLAISFTLVGGSARNEQWIVQGVIMLLLPAVLLFLKNSVKRVRVGKKEIKILMGLDIIFIVLTVAYITYTYLSLDISNIERVSVFTFIFWTILGIIAYIKQRKSVDITIEKVSSVRSVSSIDINQPIKLPK